MNNQNIYRRLLCMCLIISSSICAQEITFNVDSLLFGEVRLSDSLNRTFRITNTGSAILNVDTVLVSGSDAAEFTALSATGPFVLPSNGRRNFNFQLNGQSIGIKDAQIEIFGNQLGANPAVLHIQAEVIPIPPPDISSNVLAINYGTLQLGDTLTRFVRLQNVGQSNLDIDTLILAGADTSEFRLLTDPSPFTLIPSASRRFGVEFDPQSPGDKFASLPIYSNDPDENPLVISFQGSAFDSSRIVVEPDRYDFGGVLIGDSLVHSFTVRNDGGKDLVVSDFEMLWLHRDDFPILTTPTPVTLPPDSSMMIDIMFRPLELGTREGQMKIYSNDPRTPELQIPVFGVGLDSMPEPAIAIDPVSYDFGTRVVGDTMPTNFLVRNIGTGDLTVSTTELAGINPGDFKVFNGVGPYVLEPNDVRLLQVWFIPKAGGPRSADMHILSDAVNTDTLVVPLSGTGLPLPDIRVEDDTLDIGLVVVGASDSAELQIRNVGTANLEINGLLFDQAGVNYFSAPGVSLPLVVLPNDTAFVPVALAPDSVGLYETVLTVVNNDSDDDSVLVRVLGEGVTIPVPDIEFDRDTLKFTETVLTTIRVDSVYVINTGIAELSVSSVIFSGIDSLDFALTQQTLPLTVPAGDSTLLYVDFQPQAIGERFAVLQLFSNDPDENPIELILAGSAVAIPVSDIAVDPDSLDFGIIDLGEFTFRELFVHNNGSADLEVNSSNVQGIDSSDFKLTFGEAPFTVEPGDSQRIDVRFLPFDFGARTASLKLISNDPDGRELQIPLFGISLDTTLIDTIAPVCSVFTTIIEEERIHIMVQDTGSGMRTIEVLNAVNLDVSVPAFFPGSTDTLLLTAAKISVEGFAKIRVAFTDRRTNTSICEATLDSTTDIDPEPDVPDEFALGQNYPNPFNPTTEIEFSILDDGQRVTLVVYDILGRPIKKLIDAPLSRGFYTAEWDGLDGFGNRAASGVYVYRLANPSQELVRKMLLVR
ncbi:MAG: choice-of-anchor D domain-containing protein [Calditrichia bacterium]